ncbi:MAG TPA: nucleotidyltransferase [Rhizomicrobium sp.]|jgi:hypothetical protein|nr:nucleotidyltransferase [Rhizomicrobium sp.]
MAISENQLEIWSHQGSVTQSAATYQSLKAVLDSSSSPYANRSCVSFLQGSYGNDTNIYSDSDVDIVIRTDAIFYRDIDQLSESQKALYLGAFSGVTYSYNQFKSEVTAWLTAKYPNDVKSGSKAIFIKGNNGRRDADVLPCTQFRRYFSFESMTSQRYAEGICFWLPNGTRIVNYPTLHSQNCTVKHQNTDSWFKPMVRVIKNMRNRMIADGLIPDGIAPSYFLEGLLYNVPDDQFGGTYALTFTRSVDWINAADRTKFVCANRQFYLLRDNAHECWSPAHCDQFLSALTQFWRNW